MYIYAGIDEAGYGPLLGPLLVSRAVLAVPRLESDAPPPQLWQRLGKAVCKSLTRRQGRIAVNDSKKLHSQTAGIAHLERGVLAFAALAGRQPATLDAWLDCLGETCHRRLQYPRWYHPCDARPWQPLPQAITPGELAVARNLLSSTAGRIGVEVLDLGAAVVFEDRFNAMVAATRSKAATSFTFVAAHLREIWDRYAQHGPNVVVDHQSGRTHYRHLLAQAFPDADLAILDESPLVSVYRLKASAGPRRGMTVSFLVEAEQQHMPVALASMVSKYTRELLMDRFNAFFAQHAPSVKPTAGYATDGRRFVDQILPHLPALDIEPGQLCRQA